MHLYNVRCRHMDQKNLLKKFQLRKVRFSIGRMVAPRQWQKKENQTSPLLGLSTMGNTFWIFKIDLACGCCSNLNYLLMLHVCCCYATWHITVYKAYMKWLTVTQVIIGGSMYILHPEQPGSPPVHEMDYLSIHMHWMLESKPLSQTLMKRQSIRKWIFFFFLIFISS